MLSIPPSFLSVGLSDMVNRLNQLLYIVRFKPTILPYIEVAPWGLMSMLLKQLNHLGMLVQIEQLDDFPGFIQGKKPVQEGLRLPVFTPPQDDDHHGGMQGKVAGKCIVGGKNPVAGKVMTEKSQGMPRHGHVFRILT